MDELAVCHILNDVLIRQSFSMFACSFVVCCSKLEFACVITSMFSYAKLTNNQRMMILSIEVS